ncbi:hypothetical protein HUU42_07480 [bacterium]|nr:hypothetical protein [bacterium]
MNAVNDTFRFIVLLVDLDFANIDYIGEQILEVVLGKITVKVLAAVSSEFCIGVDSFGKFGEQGFYDVRLFVGDQHLPPRTVFLIGITEGCGCTVTP